VHFASIFALSFANVNDPWAFGLKYLQFRLFCSFIEAQTKAALLALGQATHICLASPIKVKANTNNINALRHFASIFVPSFADVNDSWVYGLKYL
jgi:hypothetical protein